jgi:hypothetical protein
VIFWRLAGGDEEELLALRVLLFDLVAIFFCEDLEDFVAAGPRIHFGWKWTTMVDESTLNLTVILHGTTQTRCIILPKATDNALITLNNISGPFFRSFTIVSLQCCPESTARITTPIRGENKDLTPTNQNTRPRTRQHPISCILVPHHDRAHGNHFYCLKSTNNKKFTDLDPFYHPHFAFPFGLPPCRIVAAAPNV